MTRFDNHDGWHRSRLLSIALILAGVVAIPIGLADPSSAGDRTGLVASAAERQQDSADARAGFPVPPHPDAPPRGPGE